MSFPTGNAKPWIGIDPVPFIRLGSPTRVPPNEIVSVPVGAGFPLTVAVTVTAWAVVILEEESVTDMVGVALVGSPTETVAVPVLLLYKEALAESGL